MAEMTSKDSAVWSDLDDWDDFGSNDKILTKMTYKNSSSTTFYSNSVQSVSTQKFIDMCRLCRELKQTIQNCGSRPCCCYVSVVGQHLPEHGQPRHLHAAALSLPRATETRSPSPELQARCQQHGSQVGSFHSQSLNSVLWWYDTLVVFNVEWSLKLSVIHG